MDKHEGIGMLGAIAQVTVPAPLPDEDPGQINNSDGLLEGAMAASDRSSSLSAFRGEGYGLAAMARSVRHHQHG